MTNHPSRNRGPYTAAVSGARWTYTPVKFNTIRECRDHAESYGDTADWCTITDAKGRIVGSHRRDSNGDGTRWYRAQAVT